MVWNDRRVSTIEEINFERVAARNDRLERIAKSGDNAWERVDLKTTRFDLPKLTPKQSFAAVDKDRASTLRDIFMAILTPDVLTATWMSFDPSYWVYGSGAGAGTFNGGKQSASPLSVPPTARNDCNGVRSISTGRLSSGSVFCGLMNLLLCCRIKEKNGCGECTITGTRKIV